MKGRIHSLETMGLVDGPGIRFVVFFQGCRLRCAYCHNPDTWNLEGGEEISAAELVEKVLRFKPYFTKSGGGVTCSGGEPLLQPDFLLEFLSLCKKRGINTVLDTAGVGLKTQYAEILKVTDLVILDLKHVTSEGFLSLTGGSLDELLFFKEAVDRAGTRLWLRHVVVPGLTDGTEHLSKLANFVNTFNNVEKIELLPYHTMGLYKYEKMGIKPRLAGVKPMNKEKLADLQHKLNYCLTFAPSLRPSC